MHSSWRGKRIIVLLAILLGGAGFAYALMRAQALPEGPQPIVWDKEACSHCHMHISDKSFASQLQTRDGQIFNFDDPGCLVHYLVDRAPSMRALWFHHSKADRWLNVAQVGFVPVKPTPMDYGYAAVDRTSTGALSFEEFSSKLLQARPDAERAEPGMANNAPAAGQEIRQ